MAGIPSIGDILMLSQLAWKIGRAFSAGRKGAPAEFLEVETEVNGLARALKLLAETLFSDSNETIIDDANQETRQGVATILLSCQQTLKDMESLVEQYQVIKKHRTSGGFSIERSWSELVLSNFRKMMWTTEGGNIQELRNMLHMHMSTITLTIQALQSKSLSQLQKTVAPMAEKIDEIHSKVTGDLSDKIEELHSIVVSLAGRSPALPAIDVRASQGTVIPLWPITPEIEPISESLRMERSNSLSPTRSSELKSYDFNQALRGYSRRESDISTAPSVSDSSDTWRNSSGRYSRQMVPSSPGSSVRRTSKWHIDGAADLPSVRDAKSEEQSRERADSHMSFNESILPPPAIPSDLDPDFTNGQGLYAVPFESPAETDEIISEQPAITKCQMKEFERAAFRNSAILCDVRGKTVDYVAPPEDETKPLEVETKEAMEACRICVVRKRDSLPDGSIRMVTSIWALSDDRTVRMQQKLADGMEIIPYASYFSPEKISLPVVGELKFHDVTYGTKPQRIAKTTWTNYSFEDVKSATLFQNELLGRRLIGTYQTTKTLRIHEGLSGVLAYQEQMCGMENLRLWHDADTDGILVMIHFSPVFRNGYLAFYLNSSACPVRVKDEGDKEVKIKGLKIAHTPEGRGGASKRRDSEGASTNQAGEKIGGKRWITGAKVEFATEVEKVLFLNKVKEVQETMILLPEL